MIGSIRKLWNYRKINRIKRMWGRVEMDRKKIELLNSVKELVFIPNTELMTTRMVAEWYEVSQATVRKAVQRNYDLFEQGVKSYTYQELIHLFNSPLDSAGQVANVWNIDAILQMGFLLQKSSVATLVRERTRLYSGLYEKYNPSLSRHSFIKENAIYNHLKVALNGIATINREVMCEDYFIDFVIEYGSKKIAVEVDEFGHINYNQEEEVKREEVIRGYGYELIRFNPDDENENNVIELINKIIKIILN